MRRRWRRQRGAGDAGAGAAIAQDAATPQPTVQEVLARMPRQALLQLPSGALQGALDGSISPAELAEMAGLFAPVRPDVMTALQQKQFVTHWLTHTTAIVEGLNEDTVGIASIDGRCSGQPIGNGPKAPYVSATYSGYGNGTVATGYYEAPQGSTCNTYINAGLSRYFVTWIYSPTLRDAWLFFGSSDSYRVWVNKTQVFFHAASGTEAFVADAVNQKVTLLQGWNLLLVKQSFAHLGPYNDPDPNNRTKYFSLRFASDASGTPMTDLRAAFDPACGDSAKSYAQLTHTLFANMAHLSGAGGSQWRTDVVFYNGTHMPWQYHLRYYHEGNNSGIADGWADVVVPPYQSLTRTDALPLLLGVSSQQKGYIVVDGQMGACLDNYFASNWVTVRAYNQSANGTFSNTVPGFAYNVWGTTGSAKPITGVRNGRFRTNVGLAPEFNSGATATVRVTISDPALASPVQQDFNVTGFWQLNDVFKALGIGNLYTDDATLTVELTSNPTNTVWFPFATVQDGNPNNGEGGTSDPVFLSSSYPAGPY